jgi:outer membrane protein TolC
LVKPDLRITNLFSVASSPVFLQSKIDSLKNLNARSLVDLSYRPKLEAFADAGFMAVKPLNIPSNFGSSIGLNFSLPIYDGHQREQQYSKIELAENTRKVYRDAYTSQYMQQLRQLQEQLRLSEELISDISSQILQQKDLIAVYRTEMEQGLVRFTDYLVIINSYSLTQNSLTVAEMNRLQLINQLNYLK